MSDVAADRSERLTLAPARTALIVVDMQNAFLRTKGSINRSGLDIVHLKAVVPAVRRLVDCCHRTRTPVVFTRYWLRSDYRDAGRLVELFPTFLTLGSMVADTWDAQLDSRIGFEPGDPIIDKQRYSAFYNTPLELILRGFGTTTLVICGVTTDICVESTIRDGFFRDFRIVVPADAVAAIDAGRHRGTLRTIRYGFGSVVRAAEICRALESAPRDQP